jgi:hypothetical protein
MIPLNDDREAALVFVALVKRRDVHPARRR